MTGSALARIWRSGTGRFGLVTVAGIVLLAVLAPLLAPYAPNALDVQNRFSPPSAAHWLATDHLGRDLLSRILYGGRIAVAVALSVTALSLAIGTLLGVAAAYAPRQGERAILILFDVIYSFPGIILALASVAVLGPSLENIILLVTIGFVPQFGRVARAQTIVLKNSPFLEAERVLGASRLRIVFHHVLPNILGPLVVLASMNVPVVITIEAGLSFLGVGIQPPLASWGSLLHDGYTYLDQSPWPVLVSGLALTLATLGFTLFGEALRDAIDPRMRREP